MKTRSFFLLAALLCASISTGASAHSPLMAGTQYNASAVVKQADALLAAGHPAQAAALYLRVADDAVAANYLDIAATLYEKAAKAYHLANDPGHEAIAAERAANVYLKQAGVTLPAGKPAPTAAAQAPVRSAAPNAPARTTASTRPAAPATTPAGAVPGAAPVWKVGDRVAAGPGAALHTATVLEINNHYLHLHYDDHYQPDSAWVAVWDIYYLDPKKRAEAAAQDQAALNSYQPHDWKVGDRVMAGPGVPNHPATVFEVSPSKNQYHLHYDDHFVTDDIWVATYDLRPIAAASQAIAAAAAGPRLGKYLILGYPGTDGQYNGYFMLQPGGRYEVFLSGGRNVGGGAYTFDASTTTVHWKSGPFTKWTGSQKFEVSREGKTNIIRLMPSTIGTNSTDSSP